MIYVIIDIRSRLLTVCDTVTVIKKLPLCNACVDLVQKLNQSNQKPKMVLPYVLFSTLPLMHQISNFV